ncbi:MAG: P1 family peptidase [Pseudomonadota bacterium]
MDIPIPIDGVTIGHAIDAKVVTGTTAILFAEPAVAAVHIMGAAPGTRDTELLDPQHTVDEVDAILLSGGSAFGLDAAGGAQAWLREQGRGIALDPVRVPIVPCAILFDLRNEGDKDWGQYSPYRELGYAAISRTQASTAMGRVGAGYGAKTATTPGGFGLAATTLSDGTQIMALAAVNAAGAPTIGDTHHYWAAPFEEDAEFGGYGLPHPWPQDAKVPRTKAGQRVAGANTTLACVITNAALTAAQAKRLAVASHDGFARALYPVHTPADGDLVFTAATGHRPLDDEVLMDLGIAAGNVTARAIAVGVHAALYNH